KGEVRLWPEIAFGNTKRKREVDSSAGDAFGLAEHPFEFSGAAIGAVDLGDAAEIAEAVVEGDFAGVRTRGEPFGEGAGSRGEAQGGIGLFEQDSEAGGGDGPVVLAIV